jgi:hypothetical protein
MMNMTRALTLLLSSAALFGQTNTAVIRGIVTDPTGNSVPGAQAVAVNAGTGVQYRGVTNDAGQYLLTDVPSGSYTFSVEKQGFHRYVRQQFAVNTGAALALDVKLEIGEITQAVTVTGEAPLVQSSSSGIDQLIGAKSIADLPLGDRRTMNVIQLNGGAVFTGYDNGQKPNFVLAGGRAQSQMFWIDGASGQNMRLGIGQMDTDPPVELVEEIKVLSNNYAAEFGGSAGGVIIETTKSGGNQVHGSAYEYLRNNVLDAPGFFAPVQNDAKVKAKLRYNVFGGTVGGPIRRNRTFFFFDYEGGRRRTGAAQTLTVPAAAQRGGDFSQTLTARGVLIPIYDPATTAASGTTFTRQVFSGNIIPANRVDAVASKIVAYYPLPNRTPDNPSGANNFRGNMVNTVLHDFWSVKIDHTLSSKDRLTGRYMFNRDNTNVISVFPDPGPDTTTFNIAHQKSGLASWSRTINPSTVNDFRVNIARRVAHALSAGVGGDYATKLGLQGVSNNAFPNIAPAGFSAMGNTNQERRQYPIDQQMFVENLTLVRGRHAFKTGFEFRRSRNHEINLPTASGSIIFGTQPSGQPGNTATGTAMASLMLGFPNSFTQQQTDELDRHSFYLAGFVQDDWKVAQSLTFNLGVRWETDTPITDKANRMNGFDLGAINPVSGTPGVVKFMGLNGFRTQPYDTDWNNFGPRLGFAWKVLGSDLTVVRGGFGILYAHPFDAGVPNAVALGFSQSVSLNTPDNGITAPFYLRNGVPNVTATRPALNDSFGAVAVGAATNTAVTFFETNRRTGYSEQFNLGIQRQVGTNVVLEVSGMGNLSRKLPSTNLNLNQIRPELLGPAHQSQRDRPYPQFTNVTIQGTTLGVSSYYAGVVKAEKRYSHGLNLVASYTFSKFLENANDTGTVAGREGGLYSDLYNRRADYGPSANDIRSRFSFSSVYELPFGPGKRWLSKSVLGRVIGGWGLGNVTLIQSGPAVGVATQTNNTNAFSAGSQRPNVSRDPNLPPDQRTVAQWFDTAAFSQPAIYMFGNAGRNILRAAGIFSMDFSVMRHFRLGEKKQLQFRGEFFNLPNHTNFSAPGNTFGSADFGTISAAGPARQIQVGARLAF